MQPDSIQPAQAAVSLKSTPKPKEEVKKAEVEVDQAVEAREIARNDEGVKTLAEA